VARFGRVRCVRVVGVGIRPSRQVVESLRNRLGAVDAELAGLVARGGDGADGLSGLIAHADDEGLSPQLGLAKALTGGVKAVHVDVEDDAVSVVLAGVGSWKRLAVHRAMVGLPGS